MAFRIRIHTLCDTLCEYAGSDIYLNKYIGAIANWILCVVSSDYIELMHK